MHTLWGKNYIKCNCVNLIIIVNRSMPFSILFVLHKQPSSVKTLVLETLPLEHLRVCYTAASRNDCKICRCAWSSWWKGSLGVHTDITPAGSSAPEFMVGFYHTSYGIKKQKAISITRLLFICTLSFTFILCSFLATFSKDNMETLALLKLMAKL